MELSEASQKEKDEYITFIWNLKYDINKLIYETETDSQKENRFVVVKGGGGGME